MLYHYIYKTTHPNGRYYIGRHTTKNLNDNYLGSGVWVSGIKDKSILKKEIICFADNTIQLKNIEEKFIAENYDNPFCMNRGLGSNGWTSEEAKLENQKRILNDTHNFIEGDISRRSQLKRVAKGIHPWIGDKNPSIERLKNGTHLWQTDEHKLATAKNNKKRFDNGSHHFLKNVVCPHCTKEGQMAAMKRWHFENCKEKGIINR
jgi:hypothetical protein